MPKLVNVVNHALKNQALTCSCTVLYFLVKASFSGQRGFLKENRRPRQVLNHDMPEKLASTKFHSALDITYQENECEI